MYIIEDERIKVIPADFNVFYNTAKEYKRNVRYSKDYTLSESFLNDLSFFIADSNDVTLVIDLKNIVSYPTRMFSRLEKCTSDVIICNIENPKIRQMLKEDLPSLTWMDESRAYLHGEGGDGIKDITNEYCSMIRKKEESRIVSKTVTCEKGKVQLLESSGLYSNCYVDVKKMFFSVDEFYFIIFSLAALFNSIMATVHIDAIVSSSKNGAIIANILGGLLDVKEVHLIGVGPKYSMELGDSVECIKKGKRYAYVFDFLCTGTELKIVSALINSKKAYLSYAIGIAKYKKNNASCMLKSLDVLVDTEDMGIQYKIAGEEKDLL